MASPYDPETTAIGLIVIISTVALLLLLLISVLGTHLGYSAIRWHVINICVWGLVHMANVSSFGGERAPFPDWIKDVQWKEKTAQVEILCRTIFPAGMVIVFMERMLITCVPDVEKNIVCNIFFGILMIFGINGLAIFCWNGQFDDTYWWSPLELFMIIAYPLFCIMIFNYLIFCLFGSCACCCCMLAGKRKRKHNIGHFAEMWLLLPYGFIPSLMYGVSYAMSSMNFMWSVVMKWAMQQDFVKKYLAAAGSGGNPMDMLTEFAPYMTMALEALPWFVLLFPLVEVILTIVCIGMYRRQFFNIITCGRLFSEKDDLDKQDWPIGGVAPHHSIEKMYPETIQSVMMPQSALHPQPVHVIDLPKPEIQHISHVPAVVVYDGSPETMHNYA